MRLRLHVYKWWLLLLLLSPELNLKGQPADTAQICRNGVADLRTTSLYNQAIALSGNWKFAWQKLVPSNAPEDCKSTFPVPGLWNGQKLNGIPLTSTGIATYALTVYLPDVHPDLALFLPDTYCSYRLFVNGRLAGFNGNPSANPLSYEPQWKPQTIALFDNSDTLHLIYQVANFSHQKGGTYKSIEIGDAALLKVEQEQSIASDFLLAGCLFMGGLFFLGLYVFGTRDRATLYFSLFCLVYSYRFIGSGAYALHQVIPALSWSLAVRLEYITLFLSIILFMQYVRNLYPEDLYMPAFKILLAVCGFVTVLPVISGPLLFTKIISPFLILMFFCIALIMITFIRAYRNKRIAAGYALHSIAVMMIVQLVLNLEYFGVIVPSRTVLFLGYVTFFFLQSLILSFRFAYTLRKAKQEAEVGLRAKSEFLSTMSHEIRTPLNSVIGMANLMQKHQPRPDQKEHLDVLQFAAGNLLNIVNDILDYNKIEAGKILLERVEVDITETLRKIAFAGKQIASDKGIELELNIDPEIRFAVVGDPTRFFQVINNLVNNAIKFTKIGRVVIAAQLLRQDGERAWIRFSIKDTGIGIAPENQRKIFDQFTQADSSTSRSFGGTGLGLAISKRILEIQGVQLHVSSELGKGSEFYFIQEFEMLEIIAETVPEQPDEVQLEADQLKGIHILLVEDNPMNVFVAKSFLEEWGAQIDVAENGQEALDLLNVQKHHIVLMDLHMPVMDGYTAVRRMREQGVVLPIIALTASLPAEIKDEVDRIGIDDTVLKPFVPEDLLSKVKKYLALSK